MIDFVVVDGREMVEKVGNFLGKEGVEYVFVYYAGPGCFAVKIERG